MWLHQNVRHKICWLVLTLSAVQFNKLKLAKVNNWIIFFENVFHYFKSYLLPTNVRKDRCGIFSWNLLQLCSENFPQNSCRNFMKFPNLQHIKDLVKTGSWAPMTLILATSRTTVLVTSIKERIIDHCNDADRRHWRWLDRSGRSEMISARTDFILAYQWYSQQHQYQHHLQELMNKHTIS